MESQQRISTRQLVDSDAEHGVLEELIEGAKPRPPAEVWPAGLHFLLSSPFRYPPLRHGSRFGSRRERSLWYGSEELVTALAEASYYRLLFLEGTAAELLPNRIPKSAFQVALRTAAAVDLTRAPFERHRAALRSKRDYAVTQRLGSELRAAGVQLVRYASARDAAGRANVGLFTPGPFARKAPLGAPQTWHCTVTGARGVSWMREAADGLERHEFSREEFLVEGSLPAPAV